MKYRLLQFNNNTEMPRRFLASFHGSHAETPGRVGAEYARFNSTLRTRLLNVMDKWKHDTFILSYGGVTADYAYIMGNSEFCLAPKGSTSYTARLYESLFAGCVPVLLSDDYIFPFADQIPWDDMVIRIAEENIENVFEILANELKHNLSSLVHRREKIAEHRCKVDWMQIGLVHCSAFNSVLQAI